MWAEILIENRHALIAPLRESITDLAELLASLEAGEQTQVHAWLSTAKQRRDSLVHPI
jgi:prephenate dehydrogenase